MLLRISDLWNHETVHTNLQLPLLGQLLNCIWAVANKVFDTRRLTKYVPHTPIVCSKPLCCTHCLEMECKTNFRPHFSAVTEEMTESKNKNIPAPICLPCFYRPPWLSQAVLTSFTLPLWKMSMNRVLFRMVMNETQNQLTALLKSITGPCSLTRKDQAHLVQVVQSWCSVPTQRAFSL